ncbi:MAG: hypothetical protein LBB89_04690 [Treponema sp.]|jgi:hypothetical protein|nr:hypothetical protein [Treponema sp.]
MRVFLSAFSGFTLAVPMNAVAAMMLYDKETEKTIFYDQANRSTYVSLPRLFNLPNEVVHHGIILREWNSKANKVVLLTAEVKRDIEIPDEQFYPIPKALGALRFSEMFSGIQFSDNPILLLNIESLVQSIQKHQRTDNEEDNHPKQLLSIEENIPPEQSPPIEESIPPEQPVSVEKNIPPEQPLPIKEDIPPEQPVSVEENIPPEQPPPIEENIPPEQPPFDEEIIPPEQLPPIEEDNLPQQPISIEEDNLPEHPAPTALSGLSSPTP